MIAKNYIKYPEALRFQCEMFGRGHTGHYPRIMRLMEVIFEWKPSTPDWVTTAKTRAAQLVKAWKNCQLELFTTMKKKVRDTWTQLALVLFPDAPEKDTATTAETPVFPPANYIGSHRWNPTFTTEKENWSWSDDKDAEHLEGMSGIYVSYCRKHQGGFQGFAGIKQQIRNYGAEA